MMSGMVFLHATRATQNLLPLLLLSVSRMDGCFYDESAFVCARVRNDDESGKRFIFPRHFPLEKMAPFFQPHTHTTHALSLFLFLSLSLKAERYTREETGRRGSILFAKILSLD